MSKRKTPSKPNPNPTKVQRKRGLFSGTQLHIEADRGNLASVKQLLGEFSAAQINLLDQSGDQALANAIRGGK